MSWQDKLSDSDVANSINKSTGFSLEIEAKIQKNEIKYLIKNANEHYCKYVGCKKEEIIGSNFEDIEDEFKCLYQQLIYYLLKNKSGDFFNLYVEKDDKKFDVLNIDKDYIFKHNYKNNFYEIMACVLSRHHKSLRILIIVKDFNREMKLISEINKILEINNYNDKIMNISEVVSNLTHSWRQPLNSLNFSIINLKDEIINETGDDKLVNEYYTEIWNIIKSLSNKIEKFRTFFEMDYEKRNYDLIRCLDLIFEILDEKIKKENIQVFVDSKNRQPKIYGSPNEFVQIMYCIFFDIIEYCKTNLDILNRKLKIEINESKQHAFINIEMVLDRKKHRDFNLHLKHFSTFKHIIHETIKGDIDLINSNTENKVVVSFPLVE